MKESSFLAYVVGILLAFLGALAVEALFIPSALGVSMVPMGVFAVAVWLNAYRTSRKKHSRII
jgi:hypothetical protein